MLLVLAALLLLDLAALLGAARSILPFPYSIDYGEGIVWQQARDILSGDAYRGLAVFPAIVYHYPPVYHLVSGGLATGFGLDGLLAGRLASLLSTLGAAALVGWLAAAAVREGQREVQLICGALAALACFTSYPIVCWALLMRVDALANLLGLAGLVFVVRSLDRPIFIHAATLAFVLAVYTKQISVAAPAAAFVTLLRIQPALAWRLVLGCTTLGSTIIAILFVLTDGGFIWHIFFYNVNRLDLGLVPLLLMLLAMHLGLIVAACFGIRETRPAILEAWSRRSTRPTEVVPLLAGLFLLLKTAMIPAMLKSGAGPNYLGEWAFALAIFAGPALRPLVSNALRHEAPEPPRVLCLIPVLALALAIPIAWHWLSELRSTTKEGAALQSIVEIIAASPRPAISDDMTLQIRAGRRVEWEPAIAAELGHTGLYDEPGFVALVRSGAFSLFLTEGSIDEVVGQRYNPAVKAAIAEAYPVARQVGRFTLRLPAR